MANNTFAQTGPPALPTLPAGRMLDAWHFQTTNWTSMFGDPPLAATNLSLTADWAGNGLLLDSTNQAYLVYPVVESDGWTNIAFLNGSLEMWFAPDWNSSDGIGNWGTLLEAGTWTTNLATATGAWGLYISPDGSNLCFSAQSTSLTTNFLTAPISWNAGEWHHIALTYSATNSALYLEGALITNGPGISAIPSASVLTNGFSVGSDGNGTAQLQARGIFNDLITYNYPLDVNTVSNRYATISPNVYPLPSGGGFHLYNSFSAPPPPDGGGGSTNGGGGVTFNSPNYTTNDFWLQFAGATNTGAAMTVQLVIHAPWNVTNGVFDLFQTANLIPSAWQWVRRCAPGQTNINVTNDLTSPQ
ncbi:MAG: hypothetical protein JWQ04_1710, partial [Pedosphaera sp.]|nr:hypothetical protein [Pedosphaera sp.]